MSALPPDSGDAGVAEGGKRKGDIKVRHTVAKVVSATLVVIALVTGLTVVFLYRHYNGNLDAEDLTKAIGTQSAEPRSASGRRPSGPINILVMGSDNRDAPGDHVDNLTGIGQRSDTTILLHLSADRSRAYGVSIPRDSVVDRPSCLDNAGKEISDAVDRRDVERRVQRRRPGLHDPAVPGAHPRAGVDHWIVVDFAGFKSMVDALGGVEVCLPHAVERPDRPHHAAGGHPQVQR